MSEVPFDDLLTAIENGPQTVADTLCSAIRDGSCTMDTAMNALREAGTEVARAANPRVAELYIGEIANGLRFADMAAFNDWVVRNGSVLGQGVVKLMPDEPGANAETRSVLDVLKSVFFGR